VEEIRFDILIASKRGPVVALRKLEEGRLKRKPLIPLSFSDLAS
jgi:hypothetical protein